MASLYVCSGSKTPTPGWGSEFLLRLSKTKPRWEEMEKRGIFLMTCFKTCFLECPVYWFILFMGFVVLATQSCWYIIWIILLLNKTSLSISWDYFASLCRITNPEVLGKPHTKTRKAITPWKHAIVCLHTLHMWWRVKLRPHPALTHKGLTHIHTHFCADLPCRGV